MAAEKEARGVEVETEELQTKDGIYVSESGTITSRDTNKGIVAESVNPGGIVSMSSDGLSVKLNVDVSDALTGLKAVQREAKMATRAVAELGETGTVVPTEEFDKLFTAYQSLAHERDDELLTRKQEIAGLGKVRSQDAKLPLKAFKTADLVEELKRREGVQSHWVPPYVNYNIGIRSESQGGLVDGGQGAAHILVVID